MKITDSHTYTFPETGETVTVEISNTSERFTWRMRIGQSTTAWASHYSEILSLVSNVDSKIHYIYLTDYWRDVLPTETVLLVKQL